MTSVVADHACSGSVEGGNDEVRQCLVAQLGSASEQRLLVRRDLHIDSLRLGVLHFACLPLCRSLGDHDLSSSAGSKSVREGSRTHVRGANRMHR
jgi:hypothetical protein